MNNRAGRPKLRRLAAGIVFYGMWAAVLILALILQAIPFFLIVMLLGLVVGFPDWAALTVIPLGFLAILYLSFAVASKLTGRSDAQPGAETRAAARFAAPNAGENPVERYRNMRQLG